MDMYTQLVCYRFELTRILLNKKNISKEDFIFIKKSLLDIKDMCYKIKHEKILIVKQKQIKLNNVF